MATVTGTNLLAGILATQGVTLSPVLQAALAARLQAAIDAGTDSNIQIAVVLGSNAQLLASVPAGQTPTTFLSSVVGTTKTEIETGVPAATYALTGAASADEGTTATFELTTTNVAEGTEVAYTLTGIDAADLASGALTGKAVVDAAGKATISVALAADATTEGAETLTVALDGKAVSAQTTVNDTSVTPSTSLSIDASAASVDEGSAVTFTITNGAANTEYAVKLEGVQAGDVTGDLLRLVTTDANGSATVTVNVVADSTTEGAETMTASLVGQTVSASVTVNDTSVNTPPVVTADQVFTINEGSAADAAIGAVAAVDAQADAITYAIASGNDDGYFAIDSATGALSLTAAGAAAIDAESATTAYTLGVVATDALGNASAATNVTINVGDISDTAPVAVDATGATTEAGTVVTGTLTATDADAVDAGMLGFTLDAAVDGLTLNADGSYSFDPSLNADAQALTYTDLPLDIVANYTVTDTGGNTDQGTLTITVTPKPLTFTIVPSATYVEEGQTISYKLVASEAVQTEITGSIQVTPGDGTAGQTAANDFGSGALNPQNVTIAVGETESTLFNLIPQNDASTEVPESYTAKATVTGYTIADVTGEVRDPSTVGGVGQTFTLTTGIDTVPGLIGSAGSTGTDGDDTFVAQVGSGDTLNALDSVNGGLGTNSMTLNLLGGGALNAAGITISNVQTINARGDSHVVIDLAAAASITGVTALNSTLSVDADLTAAATTDIGVSGASGQIDIEGGKNVTVSDSTVDENITIGAASGPAGTVTVTDTKQGSGDILVDGGTDVSITATSTTGTGVIEVGGESASPTGTVTIVQNLNDDGSGLSASDIGVLGGTKVNITVNATSKATVAGKNSDIDTGEINVLGDGKTTEVNVKQTASVTTFTTPVVAAVLDQSVVTFAALASGNTITVNGLNFTASKALTAEQVAAAFANLTLNDTQSATGPTANGFFSGTSNAVPYTSGSASGNTVTFTAAPGTGAIPVTGPTVAYTAGSSASGGVTTSNSFTFQDVDIDDAADAAITTITIDGFDDAYLGGNNIGGSGTALAAATGYSVDKLSSLSVANGGDVYLSTDATTLALKLNNISGSVDLDNKAANIATLTITTEGLASDINLTADAVATLTINAGTKLDLDNGSTLTALVDVDINGVGQVILGDISGAAGLKTVNAADNTGGVTAEMLGTVATYVGSAGWDDLTIANAGTAVSKALDLGAGNDVLTLVGATVMVPTVTLNGGDDTDTLSIDTASAAALDGDTLFAAKLSSFEHLFINNAGAGGEDINLANLGFSQLVSVAGSVGTVTLSNVANNGTVNVVGNAAGVTVNVKDAATGVADVLNVGLSAAANDLTVAEVETIALSVFAAASANLIADKATTVTLSGSGNLTLDLDAGGALTGNTVTLVDGSAGYSGALTMDALLDNLVVKGGSGADNLLANANDVALHGGDGNDTLTVAGGLRVNLHGGAGADTFVFGAGASNTLDAYTVINGVTSGDVIVMTGATGFVSTKIALSVGADETLLNYANQAINTIGAGEMGWFQKGGNTFIVLDEALNDGTTFDITEDMIIMITGLVDLGTGASFNVSNILEIV